MKRKLFKRKPELLKGDFLPGFPATHRSCRNVDHSGGMRQPYRCKVNRREFWELDEGCQFEVQTIVKVNQQVESDGRGLKLASA